MKRFVPIAGLKTSAFEWADGECAQTRFWRSFVSNIYNPHTDRAYGRSTAVFLSVQKVCSRCFLLL